MHRVESPLVTVGMVIAAPLSVIAVIEATQDVLLAFVVYHLAICLVLPALDSIIVQGRRPSDHVAFIGLTRTGDAASIWLGAGVGAASFAAIIGGFWLFGDATVGDADVLSVVEGWGLPRRLAPWLAAYMIVVNSGAEELFWRGHVHAKLELWPRRAAAIVLPSAAFASYHFVTVRALTGDTIVAALATLAVFGAALAWSWLREYSGSAWPPIVAHAGASAGYMAVYLWLL